MSASSVDVLSIIIMKKIVISIIIVIVTFALTYLSFGFIANDLNSSNWTIEARAFMVFLGAGLSLCAMLVYHDVLS